MAPVSPFPSQLKRNVRSAQLRHFSFLRIFHNGKFFLELSHQQCPDGVLVSPCPECKQNTISALVVAIPDDPEDDLHRGCRALAVQLLAIVLTSAPVAADSLLAWR